MIQPNVSKTFTVVVSAAKGKKATYTIKVGGGSNHSSNHSHPPPPPAPPAPAPPAPANTTSDATLSQLSVSPGTLAPTFSPLTTGYAVAEDPAVPTVQLTAVANDSAASVAVNGVASTRKGNDQIAVTMNATRNTTAKVLVTSADGKLNMTCESRPVSAHGECTLR